jgi:uncharacterized DUF497 family protein
VAGRGGVHMMDFECDPQKARENIPRACRSLTQATAVFWAEFSSAVSDPDHSHAESRYVIFGQTGAGGYLVVSFMQRCDRICLISACVMTRWERRAYEGSDTDNPREESPKKHPGRAEGQVRCAISRGDEPRPNRPGFGGKMRQIIDEATVLKDRHSLPAHVVGSLMEKPPRNGIEISIHGYREERLLASAIKDKIGILDPSIRVAELRMMDAELYIILRVSFGDG